MSQMRREKCPIREAEEEFKYAAVCAIGIKLTVATVSRLTP